MRMHIQGIALLGLLVVALWGATRLAAPTLSGALGADGAVVAESAEDQIELTVESETLDAPLTEDELMRLQLQLVRAEFLDDASEVDGIWGDRTRSAIAEAAAEWGLTNPSDRAVLVYANELFDDIPLFGEAASLAT